MDVMVKKFVASILLIFIYEKLEFFFYWNQI